mgnify:CR=1 FL=1
MNNQFALFGEDGRVLRDAGIKAAADHAERVSPSWAERALGYVKEYACYHVEFTGEDCRMFAEAHGFTFPHGRAWGNVMLMAARRGIVKKVGTRQVKNPRAHCAIATLWRRTEVEGSA